MENKSDRRGLGRGLSALMSDIDVSDPKLSGVGAEKSPRNQIAIEKITPNPNQPRREFGAEQLKDLAASIKKNGILQPLILRPTQVEGHYEIVAGERRWRAAQIAQLHEVPAIIRDFNDLEVLEVAIIENIQRSDLNPIEEASAYKQLMERFGHTQEVLAESLSKSRSHIANLLRLLALPDEVQSMVRSGTLSAGHARALITSGDALRLANQVVSKGLSVRETERLVREFGTNPTNTRVSRGRNRDDKDADTRALEADLSNNLKMAVTIQHEPGGERGVLSIRYNTLDDLDALCRTLSQLDHD